MQHEAPHFNHDICALQTSGMLNPYSDDVAFFTSSGFQSSLL